MHIFYNRGGKNILAIAKKFVIKLPVTINSCQNLLKNKHNIIKAKKDRHFHKYIPSSFHFFFIEFTQKYEESNLNRKSLFIKKYKKKFIYLKNKNKNKKIEIIKCEFYQNFLALYKNKNIKKKIILKFFNKSIVLSACHGDFYYKNILKSEHKYVFIDWDKYEQNASIYFDFINYDIFSKELYSGNWYKVWKRNYKEFQKNYPKIYLDLYVIWKISSESQTQKNTNSFLNKINIIVSDYAMLQN